MQKVSVNYGMMLVACWSATKNHVVDLQTAWRTDRVKINQIQTRPVVANLQGGSITSLLRLQADLRVGV